MVVLVPILATPPGLISQFPAGKPDNSTLPVATEQVGCVIVPTVGAAGVSGCVLIATSVDAKEIHPAAFVTVKLYIVPSTKPDMVVLVVEPVITPGLITQFPAGNPDNSTLPVATEQMGCVIVPTVGAAGVSGCVLITISVDAKEVHPSASVTV